MRIFGLGQQLILHGNPSTLAWNFSPRMAVLRRGNFDIFAASGESTACAPLENPFKTHWREGVSCDPVQLFQPQLITPENEGKREHEPKMYRVSDHDRDLH